jgi:hypothetical protein
MPVPRPRPIETVTGAGPQHEPPPADSSGLAEHTPVSGSSRCTSAAASRSPSRYAVIERTCSYPVAIRNVGARP